MTESGGPPSIGGTRENPAQPGNMFSHLLTHAPATAGARTSSRVPPSASSAHLGPFGGGPSRVVLPTMGVSPAQSSQLAGPLTGHAMQVQSNNGVTRDLLQRNCVPASSAMLPPRNGVSESSAMLARSNHRFSFQSPQPHYAAPNDDINSRVSAQIHPNYYPASIMMNRPYVPCQPSCTGTSRSFSQFLARPRQEVPIEFPMERGVLNGPIPMDSNPLMDSSVLEALGSSQAQSVGLHNVVQSARRGTLTREAGSRFVQEREPIGRNNELAFLMGTRSVSRRELIHELAFLTGARSLQLTELTCFEVRRMHMGTHLAGTRPMQRTELAGFNCGRLHGHRLLAGIGSVQPTVPGFNIGLFHGHTPLRGPRPVSHRQPMGLFASMTRGGERATATATNGPMVWRVTRMVRIVQTTTRARADILAAARGRGRQGGANQDLSNWTNQRRI